MRGNPHVPFWREAEAGDSLRPPIGNLLSSTTNGTTTTNSYNSGNELMQSNGATFSYDADGNETGDSSGNSFTYNALGQTTGITTPSSGPVSQGYRGVGQGQRLTSGGVSYQYDLTGLSTITNGATTTHVIRTPDGQLLSEQVVNGSNTNDSYYLVDGSGSVTDVTDMKGDVQNQYQYDPYGNIQGTAQETVPNSFRYVGAVWDSSTGLYKMGARYYSSTLARFTQPDPEACSHTRNVYSYAADSPITYGDPSGLRIGNPGGGSITFFDCFRHLSVPASAFIPCLNCVLATLSIRHVPTGPFENPNCVTCKSAMNSASFREFANCISLVARGGFGAGGGAGGSAGEAAGESTGEDPAEPLPGTDDPGGSGGAIDNLDQ